MLLMHPVSWFFTLYIAIKSFSKQNLTIEDLVSHGAHMASSSADGKLRKVSVKVLMKGLFKDLAV